MARATAENESEVVELTITYDGPEVAAGRMDARDLAPAMLATAKLFEHSAAQLYGATAGIKIDVQADFQRGSFSYALLAAQAVNIGKTLISNLSISDVIATATALVVLVRAARGRRPAAIERRNSDATITFHEGDSLTVSINTVNLYSNSNIREDLEGAVEPLKKPGIDTFQLTSPGVTATVAKDEVEYFAAPVINEEILQDRDSEEIIEVLAPDFQINHKWQFRLAGGDSFWATILDKEFVADVSTRKISFGSGDALRVILRVLVRRKPNGKFDRINEVKKVLEIVAPPPPLSLFDE